MFGDNPKDSRAIARIVNRHHFLRLKNLLDDPNVRASVVHGGFMDEDSLYVSCRQKRVQCPMFHNIDVIILRQNMIGLVELPAGLSSQRSW